MSVLKKLGWLAPVLVLTGWTMAAHAQEIEPVDEYTEVLDSTATAHILDATPLPDNYSISTSTMALTLFDCMDRAIQENLKLEIESVNPGLREQDIRAERSVYDPVLNGHVLHTDSDTPTSSALSGAGEIEGATLPRSSSPIVRELNNEDTIASFGASQYLQTGTSYEVSLDYDRAESSSAFAGFNPEYEWGVSAQVSQHLLQGLGAPDVRARIKIAENNQESAQLSLALSAMDLTVETVFRYWELVFAHADLNIKRQSRDLALDLLRIKRAEVDAGVEAPIEIVSASAGVAQREQDVIIAENDIDAAADQLRRIINVGADPDGWDQPIRPADEPVFQVIETNLDASIDIAMEKQPLLAIARLGVDNQDISIRAAKNRLLPSLDLTGGLRYDGLEGSSYDAFDELSGGDYYTWNVGLLFNYPLGNNAARSALNAARLRKDQSTLQLEDARQGVIQDVRTAVREINNSRKRIDAAIAARILARERLDSISKTYGVGLATSYDVLQYQEDYTQAQVDEMRAIIDYIQSIAALQRAQGTILADRGMVME